MSFGYTRPDFELQAEQAGVKDSVSGDLALNFIDADLTWRFFNRPNTPFLMLGIGPSTSLTRKWTAFTTPSSISSTTALWDGSGGQGPGRHQRKRAAVMTEMDYWPTTSCSWRESSGRYRWGPHHRETYR